MATSSPKYLVEDSSQLSSATATSQKLNPAMQILSVLVLSAIALVVEAIPQGVTVDPPDPSTFTVFPPTLTVHPTPTTRPTLTVDPTPTVRPTECVCPGRLLCCKALVSSEDPAAQGPLDQLGVVIDGTDIPVGLSCTPYTANTLCRTPPVCCFDSRKPEVAAIGCVKVPEVRPTPTPTITFTTLPTFTTIPTFTTRPTLTLDPTFGPIDPTIRG